MRPFIINCVSEYEDCFVNIPSFMRRICGVRDEIVPRHLPDKREMPRGLSDNRESTADKRRHRSRRNWPNLPLIVV